IYGTADLAFLGGSLVPVGGHNLLEPAALGVAVVTGHHLYNTEDIADMLMERGGLRIVNSPAQLADETTILLSDPARRAAMSEAARGIVDENRGAVDRLISLIDPLL
ncbi:MAG: 3-deoxy-D-manno-octulosonic acid transferase, partial [Pseudomonadota bacterium]